MHEGNHGDIIMLTAVCNHAYKEMKFIAFTKYNLSSSVILVVLL